MSLDIDSPRPSSDSYRHLSEIDSLFTPENDVYEPDENDLSEAELRELYDREEIDRFLNLFSTVCTSLYL